MLKARLAGILRPLLLLYRVYAGLLSRRRRALGATATLLAALLTLGLAGLLLWGSGPAQAQEGEPPVVANLRCIAETERVAFLWDAPEWSGGETYAYDYQLTLPGGRSEGGRLIGSTLLYRPGAYPTGKTASVSVKTIFETADGRQVASEAAELICNVGGARELSITPGNTTRVYGGTDAMSYTVSGLVDGDAAGDVVSGSLGRTAGDDVGSYAINLGTLAMTPTYAQKYALPSGPTITTYTITPKPAAWTGTAPAKGYDGTTTVTGALSGSFAAGDILSGDEVTVSGGSYASADVGTGIAIVGSSVGGTDAGNYDVTFNVRGDITPLEITTIGGVKVNARVADGTTDATFDTRSAQGSGVLPGELWHFRTGGLVVSGTFPSAGTGSHDLSVTYSLQDHGVFKAGNYTLSPSAIGATLRGELQDASAQPLLPTRQPATSDGRELLLPSCEPDPDAAPAAQDDTIVFVMCDDDVTIESVVAGSGMTFYPNFSPHRHNYLIHVPDSVQEVKVLGKFKPPMKFNDGGRHFKVPGYAWAFADGESVSNPDLPASDGLVAGVTATNSATGHKKTLNVSLSPGVTAIRIGAGKWFQRTGPSAEEGNALSYPEYFYSSAKTVRKTYTLQLVWKSPGTTLEAPDEPAGPARTEDYDADNDGLIEVSNLAQLDAIRWDLDGDGYSDHGGPLHQGFPNAMLGMGCPSSGCLGYELVADLDFDTNHSGDADAGDDYWNRGHGWLPIGMDIRQFRAVFEGNGHVISNLYISSNPEKQSAASGYTQGIYDVFFKAAHIGLFEEIGSGGVVRNVGLADADVSRTFTCRAPSRNHCAHEYVGVVAGSTAGRISGSWTTGVVSHQITRGWAWRYGALSAAVTAGGLVGYAHSSSVIANSYAAAAVSVHSDSEDHLGTKGGGLVGHNDGSIFATYATGSVHTNQWEPERIFYPHKPSSRAGGLVGHNRGPIKASYSTGRVTGGRAAYGRTGLVGWDEGDAHNGPNYFDTNTSGQYRSPFGRGKTTAELQGPAGYAGIYASWNADLDGDGNGDDPWDFGTSRQYPVLSSLGAAKQRARMLSRPDLAYSISPRASAVEGQSATLTITLIKNAPADGVVFTVTPGYGGRATASAADVGSITSPVTVTQGNTTLDITIPTVEDPVDENDETFTVTIASSNPGWVKDGDGKDTATVTITDDDTAGVRVTAANPVTVTEGSTNTYAVVLTSQPTADVTVTPSSADVDAAAVSQASHIFTPSGWNTATTFTVSGVADADSDDESVVISHRATSRDGKYDGIVVATVSVAVSDSTPLQQVQTEPEPSDQYAELIAKMKQWRDDPCCASDQAHTDRWDRTLLAFGETVSDTTLTPMTADEAQGYADRGWERWTSVVAALREIESAPQQQQAASNRAPTVASAIADATIVNESGTQTVSLSGVFSDADADALTVTAGSSNTAVAAVSVAADQSSLTVSAQARGTATITVTAADGNGGTVSDTFTVIVKATLTVASGISDVAGLEVDATQDVSLSGVFSDADNDALTITAASSDDAIATVTVASDGSKLTLAGVAEGTVTFTVTAQDTDGNRVSDAFDAPVARRYNALIAQIKQWRNDPCCASNQAHTDRWDRTLLTFGETVADTTLTPMTADEAQGYADRGWERWVPVVAALREIEASGSG